MEDTIAALSPFTPDPEVVTTRYTQNRVSSQSRDSGSRAHGFQARSVVYSRPTVNSSKHVALVIVSDLRCAPHTPRLLGADARTP
jgi:hypothetical protein